MFSRTAKLVVKNFGQKNYHAGKISLENTRALVSAAESSGVPGIRAPLVEQTAEKPVLNPATTSEQNGLVSFATKKNSINEKSKHDATNDDMTLTSGTVGVEAQKTPNSYESSLPQGLELPKSEAGEFLNILRKVPPKDEPISGANRQLRTFPVYDLSQDLGISKQKTEIRRSVTESAQILGEMGPSSHFRSSYTGTDFGMWLPELLEYYGTPDINDTGCHGCSHYSLPSLRRKRTKRRLKNRRKKTLSGREREATPAKVTADNELDRQMCSAMVFRNHGSGLNQGTRRRRQRVKGVDDRIGCSKCVPTNRRTSRQSLTEGGKLRVPKIPLIKRSKVNSRSCRKKSQKRFFQKCDTARESWIIPAILSNRKPKLLHNFNDGKKPLKPELAIGAPNLSSLIQSSTSKSRRQGQIVSVKTVKNTHEKTHGNSDKKQKSKRNHRYLIASRLYPEGKTSAVKKFSKCLPVSISKSANNTGDEVLGLDVESLSIACTHECQSLGTLASSTTVESFVDNCSSEISTAVSPRAVQNAGETCRSESKGSFFSSEHVVFSNDCTQGDSEDAGPNVVQQLRISISSQKMKQSSSGNAVVITSTSLLTIPSSSVDNRYGSLDTTEHASGEPKDFEKKSDCKKLKKYRSGFGKLSKRLSRSGISKKKKKCPGMKIVQYHEKRG